MFCTPTWIVGEHNSVEAHIIAANLLPSEPWLGPVMESALGPSKLQGRPCTCCSSSPRRTRRRPLSRLRWSPPAAGTTRGLLSRRATRTSATTTTRPTGSSGAG